MNVVDSSKLLRNLGAKAVRERLRDLAEDVEGGGCGCIRLVSKVQVCMQEETHRRR